MALSPFLASFRAPHLLRPHRLHTHRCSLDYDLVKFFLILGNPAFAFGSPTLLPLIDHLAPRFTCPYLPRTLYKSLPAWPRQEASAPPPLPFLFAGVLLRPPFDDKPNRRAVARSFGLRLLQPMFPLFFAINFTLSRQTDDEPLP